MDDSSSAFQLPLNPLDTRHILLRKPRENLRVPLGAGVIAKNRLHQHDITELPPTRHVAKRLRHRGNVLEQTTGNAGPKIILSTRSRRLTATPTRIRID